VLALAACGGGEESAPTTSAEVPSTAFAAAGCPVDDPAACERAALAATALEEGDTAALVKLSYADTFVCDDLPAEMFPDCAPGETLEGHAVTGADGKIGILSAGNYATRLAELAEVTVAGVGTCGPEDPDVARTTSRSGPRTAPGAARSSSSGGRASGRSGSSMRTRSRTGRPSTPSRRPSWPAATSSRGTKRGSAGPRTPRQDRSARPAFPSALARPGSRWRSGRPR